MRTECSIDTSIIDIYRDRCVSSDVEEGHPSLLPNDECPHPKYLCIASYLVGISGPAPLRSSRAAGRERGKLNWLPQNL